MFIVKILYLLLVAVLSVFFILYIDPLSLILLITVASLPLILWLVGMIAKLGTKIEADVYRTVVTKGTPVNLKITADNRTPFAVSCVKVLVSYQNKFRGEKATEKIVFVAPARQKTRVKFELKSEHCGQVHVEISRALFHDPFRVWTYRKKINRQFDITFIPESHPLDAHLNLNSSATFDADTFSKHKSGDDPSEVFKIRDYQGGDKLNRIHWKLSLKTDNLLVKEYSLPINHAIVLLLEFNPAVGADDLTYADGVIESASAISSFLIENEISHTIAWYDKNTEYYCKKVIESQEDLFETVGVLLQNRLYENETPALVNFTRQRMLEKCSHLLYITPQFTENEMAELDDPTFRFSKTVVLVTREKSLTEENKQGELNLVTVSPDDIGESLYNLII